MISLINLRRDIYSTEKRHDQKAETSSDMQVGDHVIGPDGSEKNATVVSIIYIDAWIMTYAIEICIINTK